MENKLNDIAVSIVILLLLPACTCGVKIDSKPIDSSTTTSVVEPSPPPEADVGLSEDERKIQAIMQNFTVQQIEGMLFDIPATDHRPETEKNWDLLSKAKKRLVKPDLSRPDAVNEKLRGL